VHIHRHVQDHLCTRILPGFGLRSEHYRCCSGLACLFDFCRLFSLNTPFSFSLRFTFYCIPDNPIHSLPFLCVPVRNKWSELKDVVKGGGRKAKNRQRIRTTSPRSNPLMTANRCVWVSPLWPWSRQLKR